VRVFHLNALHAQSHQRTRGPSPAPLFDRDNNATGVGLFGDLTQVAARPQERLAARFYQGGWLDTARYKPDNFRAPGPALAKFLLDGLCQIAGSHDEHAPGRRRQTPRGIQSQSYN
jgi:hypothetical protein